MNNNLAQILPQNHHQNPGQNLNKDTKSYQKYHSIQSTEARGVQLRLTISPPIDRPTSKHQQLQNTHQLRLPDARREDEKDDRVKTRAGKRSKLLMENVEEKNQRQVPIKEKSSNVLKLFNLQEEEQEIQQVKIEKTSVANRANQLITIPLDVKPAKQQSTKNYRKDKGGYANSVFIQYGKETLQRKKQNFQNKAASDQKGSSFSNIRYNGQTQPQIIKEDQQPNMQRSRLFDATKTNFSNIEYVNFPQTSSRTQLDTGIQITSSREQFSSREIVDSKNLANQERNHRVKSMSQNKPSCNNNSQKIGQDPQKHSRLLKNGKFSLINQEIDNIFKFIMKPMSIHKTLQTTITRNKQCQKLCFIDYDLVTNEGKYLLSCKKMPFHLGSTYHLSLMKNQFGEKSDFFIAKIEANFLGTIFNIFTPRTQDNKQLQLAATVYYSPDFNICKPTPRQMQVYVKNPTFTFEQLQGQSSKRTNLKQLYILAGNLELQKIKKFVNKKPVWRQYAQSFVLDFRGKSKIPSVKNTILVHAEDQRQEALLLAKTAGNQFSLDLSYPFSPLVGFAVAITGFDFKLASE